MLVWPFLVHGLAETAPPGGAEPPAPPSKERVLRALVGVLPLPDGMDRDLLLHLFLAREASASTGVGGGIALPHVRNPIVLHVPRPLITLAFLDRPVDFGALDGKPVQVLFSLISPTTRAHLQLLSRLSFALHDGHFRELLLRQAPREEIAQRTARQLVLYHRRAGGQSQFSSLLELKAPTGRFAPLLAWARENLDAPLTVEDMAERAGMRARHFSRAFIAETGTTPSKAGERLRIEVAIVLALSLGASAVYSIVALINRLSQEVPISQQTATLNPSLSERPVFALVYQLPGIFFDLAPVRERLPARAAPDGLGH